LTKDRFPDEAAADLDAETLRDEKDGVAKQTEPAASEDRGVVEEYLDQKRHFAEDEMEEKGQFTDEQVEQQRRFAEEVMEQER
jgi:hypothetical protein